MGGLAFSKKSMHFVAAWWHRCAPLPREIITFSSFFRMSHAFCILFWGLKTYKNNGHQTWYPPKYLAKCMIHSSLSKNSMHFAAAWWHRCASLPRKINTFFWFFQMYHAFCILFWLFCCYELIRYPKVLKMLRLSFDNNCRIWFFKRIWNCHQFHRMGWCARVRLIPAQGGPGYVCFKGIRKELCCIVDF